MKDLNIKFLQKHFIGKPCTIFLGRLQKQTFTEVQFNDFFFGIVDRIDEDGVFIKHIVTKCLSFFPMNNIMGICEEQIAYEEKTEEPKKENQKIDVSFLENKTGLIKK